MNVRASDAVDAKSKVLVWLNMHGIAKNVETS
jgi:hypothetical protein